MSFTRVNSIGWGTGDVLTSAQANQLDVDHANALDKTSAGDTLAGVVTTSGAGSIHAATAGGVEATVAGGITANAQGGIQSGVSAGIALTGGTGDQITFGVGGASPRTRTLAVPLDAMAISNGTIAVGNIPDFVPMTSSQSAFGGTTGTSLVTAVASTSNPYAYYVPLRGFLHNGATLTSATLYLQGASGHANVPTGTNLPSFGLMRWAPLTGTLVWLAAGNSPSFDTTGTLSAYKALHSWSFACNQDNVIDRSQYDYYAVIWDESGANAVSGNMYTGMLLNFGSIANMQFP